ncbi:hypothetical protein P167DRAFT_190854 [Morchella conica CCBAS932]|uniref:Uncharacterized protein n=1 Tax=Morchella conica CCBAS932 TaxID=1392247 RepID=A0A3N4L7X5_9PEZI|nr:hypothetical protein P167DRAFT_190854 [Morchella conica CCBAS932]
MERNKQGNAKCDANKVYLTSATGAAAGCTAVNAIDADGCDVYQGFVCGGGIRYIRHNAYIHLSPGKLWHTQFFVCALRNGNHDGAAATVSHYKLDRAWQAGKQAAGRQAGRSCRADRHDELLLLYVLYCSCKRKG